MAKKATAAGDKPKAKKAKTAKGSSAPKGAKAKKAKSSSKSVGAADVIFKLAEHPIVAELIAVGATAAVAAIAQGASSKTGKTSARAVKDAGKAAATAIGARLMDEFKAVKKSAESASKKGS